MVLIISTLKVANGMEEAVRQAFLERPGIVDNASGFLGIEVAVDLEDGSIFHLATRWTDEESFKKWHSGPLHKLAHRGIPKGLKLDATWTSIRKFEVLPLPALPGDAEPTIAGLSKFLARSRSIHWLRITTDGRIVAVNAAFKTLFQENGEALEGQSLWDRVTSADRVSLEAILLSGDRVSNDPILINFLSGNGNVQTLECQIERHGPDFVLAGEPVQGDERELTQQLLELNNRWALLARENEKNLKALRQAKEETEKALKELDQSHWHLRKIQETLPICMYCGKVKTGVKWEGVVEYLKANSLFLSHGCCPSCLDRMDGNSSRGETC